MLVEVKHEKYKDKISEKVQFAVWATKYPVCNHVFKKSTSAGPAPVSDLPETFNAVSESELPF